ncbi:MAG TPA: BON domain-containing protein [Thermoanaerobaculia bacterium]|nr:BON domain-containing protein [Thermoanaerobaculia bacterium]
MGHAFDRAYGHGGEVGPDFEGDWEGPAVGPEGGFDAREESRGTAFRQQAAGGQIPAEWQDWSEAADPPSDEPRPEDPEADARIERAVREVFRSHAHLGEQHLGVRVERGEVTLTGTLEQRSLEYVAEDLAQTVSGVRSVRNLLRGREPRRS